MKRHMTIAERQQLRQDILAREIARAYERATKARRTLVCQDAIAVTGSDPARARAQHASCRGEEPGNSGCLCECHDVITSTVEAGTMTEMP